MAPDHITIGVSSTQKVGRYFGANVNVGGAKSRGVCKEQLYCS